MVAKGFGITVAGFVAMGTATQAQQWTAVDNNTVRTASVSTEDATIRFDCPVPGATVPNAIALSIGAATINGPVTFTFDNGTSVAGIFSDGLLQADSAEKAAVFTLLRDLMRSQNRVSVAARGLTERGFALNGSGNAIGTCPVQAIAATPAPPTRPDALAPTPDAPAQAAPDPESPVAVAPTESGTSNSPITGDPFVDYRLADCARGAWPFADEL